MNEYINLSEENLGISYNKFKAIILLTSKSLILITY